VAVGVVEGELLAGWCLLLPLTAAAACCLQLAYWATQAPAVQHGGAADGGWMRVVKSGLPAVGSAAPACAGRWPPLKHNLFFAGLLPSPAGGSRGPASHHRGHEGGYTAMPEFAFLSATRSLFAS